MAVTVLHLRVHLILLCFASLFQLICSLQQLFIRQQQLGIITDTRSHRHSQLFHTLREVQRMNNPLEVKQKVRDRVYVIR